MRKDLVFVGLLAFAAWPIGCSVSSWNDFEAGASVVTVASTKPFPSQTFGTLLATYTTTNASGDPLSRIAVSSGRIDLRAGEVDGMFAVYGGWNDDHLALGGQIYAHCNGDSVACPPDSGTSMAAMPDVVDSHGCLVVGAPDAPTTGQPTVLVSCESSDSQGATPLYTVNANAAATDRFGAAVAGLPANTPNIGAALVTAPGASQLWVLDGMIVAKQLPIVGLSANATSGVGDAIAVAPITSQVPTFLQTLPAGSEHALVALSSSAENRVYIAVARFAAGAALDATVVGCVDSPSGAGFGTALAAGDVSGDGIPELFISSNLGLATRTSSVSVVSLGEIDASAGTPIGCTDPTPADDPRVRPLDCVDDGDGSCDGFGASMAVGDANGDGLLDLLVGAPLATVGTTSHAGAAFLYVGQTTLDVFVSDTNAPAVLVDSSPSVNDTLGLSVAFLPSQLRQANAATDPRALPRAEPIASAPGGNRIFVFLCSGFPGDAITEDPPRCIVQP